MNRGSSQNNAGFGDSSADWARCPCWFEVILAGWRPLDPYAHVILSEIAFALARKQCGRRTRCQPQADMALKGIL